MLKAEFFNQTRRVFSLTPTFWAARPIVSQVIRATMAFSIRRVSFSPCPLGIDHLAGTGQLRESAGCAFMKSYTLPKKANVQWFRMGSRPSRTVETARPDSL